MGTGNGADMFVPSCVSRVCLQTTVLSFKSVKTKFGVRCKKLSPESVLFRNGEFIVGGEAVIWELLIGCGWEQPRKRSWGRWGTIPQPHTFLRSINTPLHPLNKTKTFGLRWRAFYFRFGPLRIAVVETF